MQNKQSFLMNLVIAAFLLLPMAAFADGEATQLAKWTFDSGYTVEGNVYTPNAEAWAQVGWNGFGTLPKILPNECAGDAADYYVSAKGTRFWGIMDNNGDKILSLYQDMDPNDISDYADASQHNQYFEFAFPTTGMKDIDFTFSYTCGDNTARAMEMVVSTDGGQTWNDAGSFEGAAYWWIYNTNTVRIAANNKESVIVRLIAPNGATAQWRMNEASVTGVAQEGATVVNENDFTLSWPLGKGTDDATAAEVRTPGLFSVAEFDYGQMTISTQRSAGTSQQTLYLPSVNNSGTANDDDVLTFTVKPKKGLTFAPKTFAFEASRWGTNGGKYDVVAIAGGQTITLATAVTPERGNDALFTSASYDLSNITVDNDGLVLKIKVYNLASNKEYGFGNITLTGDVTGTIEAVSSYTISLGIDTEGAGKVSCNPAGSEFDEGTQLTVTATENFGYHFIAWTDAEGQVVSEENPYTFEITENTTLIASYSHTNTYAINLTLEGGANANLVQFQPEGNVVNGVHWYEEGTDVKLTALNNKILTFMNWEDNSTAAERIITMDEEKNMTATFSAVDYIVGWDLYEDEPKTERAADYKADSENAGLLSLHTADGRTSSWLTRGIHNGQENGKFAARSWRPLADKYYFEISFSSKGYSNLVFSSAVGDDYNTYSVINAEYSIDGQEYKKFGTFNLPYRGWDGPHDFALPEEANNQDRVWIRWMPDYESEMIGVSDTKDGIAVAEIFVLADASALADETATFVSSNPENGAADVSASGSVILTFDNKIKAGEGNATLNGEEIAPIISGKSAVFKYSGLEYATTYTFTMPEGVLVSRSGKPVAAAEITFTTMERTQPAAKVYDAIVAQDGSGDYTTVQAAVDGAPENRATPWLVFIKNGRYNEHVDIPATKTYLHFIGQNRDKVVIVDNKLSGGANAVPVDPGATVVVKGNDAFFENLTIENSYGYEKLAGPQALALNTVGDRIAFNNVALLSYQDTWITASKQANRHYIKNSLIEGAVDFIYNGGDVYLDGDTLQINRPSGGYIVAPSHTADTKWGYVFMNNIIRPRDGINVTDVWLGRPWHNQPKTVFINTQTFVNIPPKGWYNTMGGLPVLWADYNTTDANGNPLDLSQRETYYYYTDDSGVKHEAFNVKNFLTPEEAAQYTVKNVMSGNDNWQPELLCEACDAPRPVISENTISWEAVPYAICYVVTKGDEVLAITTDLEYEIVAQAKAMGVADVADYRVQAVNENGGLSTLAAVGEPTAISELTTSDGQAVAVEFYSIDGKRLTAPQKGLNIVRTRYADGSSTSAKVTVK